MALTSFPQGVSSFGFPVFGNGSYMSAGNVFWVGSLQGTDGAGRGLSPAAPFKTINYALTKCSAPSGSKVGGDYIFVLPGHVETISNDGGLTNPVGSISANVNGVTVVGLGTKANRPLIQWNATAGKLELAAANVRFSNLVFDLATQIASVVIGINITGTGYLFDNCDFIASTTAQAAVITVNLAAGWGDVTFDTCNFRSSSGLPVTSVATSLIAVAAGNRLVIRDSFLNADASTSLIDGGTAIITNLLIDRVTWENANAARLLLKGNNSSTGIVRDSYSLVNGGAVAGVVSGTGWAWINCFGKGTASGTASGIAVPGTQSY